MAGRIKKVYQKWGDELFEFAEVKHGRWEKQDDYSCCSHCGQAIADACVSWFNYCPNCGAIMDE